MSAAIHPPPQSHFIVPAGKSCMPSGECGDAAGACPARGTAAGAGHPCGRFHARRSRAMGILPRGAALPLRMGTRASRVRRE